jgi:hypothetical protein
MLGNLNFTLQLESRVLVYSQVADFLCSEEASAKPNLGAH